MNHFCPQLADFDGNGRTDILSGSSCCQRPDCFYVYRRQEDGSFGERETIALDFSEDEFKIATDLHISGLTSRVAVGDWNGDSIPDAVIGNFASGGLGVVYGPLDRVGALPVRRFWPRDQMPFTGRIRQPVLADWDGDGLVDLVFVGHVGDRNDWLLGVYWMRNIGTATEPALAGPRLPIADTKDWKTHGVCVADWNGDGRLDLIAARTKYGGQSRPGGPWVTLHNKVWVSLRQGR